MYLLYLDDSGSAANPGEKHLVLGGISIFEGHIKWFIDQLDGIAAKLYSGNARELELHASEIFSGRKPPWNGMTKDERRQVIRDVLGVLRNCRYPAKAFACVVHKASYPGRDSVEVAFEDLCSRFDLQLKRIYAVEKNAQRGLIVLDKSSYETSLQSLALRFRELGTRWGVLKNINEVPMFVDSKASRLVQLADHVAYSVFRRYEAGDTSYLDIILSKFDAEEGRLHGLVHKQMVETRCMCPACMSRS
jgi:hypothetical protein